MAIPDHQISDLKSFEKVTGKQYQVAGIYFFCTLDCLVELAHRISHDFFARPELFTDLTAAGGQAIPPTLARLHARYGCDEAVLNREQRHALYAALFGRSPSMDGSVDEESDFRNLGDELMDACATFVETKFGDEPSLRENVRQKHRLFKEYLTGLTGDSVAWSRETALPGVTEKASYPILRNKGVAAVYGIATPPRAEWPYTFDANADKLVEKVSKQLMWPDASQTMDSSGKPDAHRYISREEITNLQRTAIEGATAIATTLDVDSNATPADVDLLIRKCYTWGTALRNLHNYSRGYTRRSTSRPAELSRGGISVAQPLSSEFMHGKTG